jgi:hypothetical protein
MILKKSMKQVSKSRTLKSTYEFLEQKKRELMIF